MKKMKFFLFTSLCFILLGCKKNVEAKCIDCDLIREFKINTILPQKYGQDTVYVYDIITTNYCSNKSQHYIFESNTLYKKKINECLSISCITDSKGTQKCEIK
jgi:hypothetical protein